MDIKLSNISNVNFNSLDIDVVKFNNEKVWSKARSYIKDGLQLWLDGIENTRNGHTSIIATWQDLSGNDNDFRLATGAPAKAGENYIPFARNRVYRCDKTDLRDLLNNVKDRTIEVVCSIDDDGETAGVILLGGGTSSYTTGAGLWYRPASKGICVASTTAYANIVSDIANPHIYSAVYNGIDFNSTKLYQDNVLSNKTSGGNMSNLTYVTLGGRYYSGNYSNYMFSGNIYCIRVYDRKLTDAEREHNRKVDIERFGL